MTQQRRRYSIDLRRYYRIPSVQVSLGIVLSLFIITFFVAFAIRPTFATIARLHKEIEESKKVMSELETKVKSLNKANDLLTKITPLLEKVDASIPEDEAGTQNLTAVIELMAKQAGVSVETTTIGESLLYSKTIDPFNPDKKKEVVELPFTVKVTGSFESCMQMLQNVVRVARIASVDNVTVSKEGAKKQASNLTIAMTINGKAYYLANKGMLDKAFFTKKDK